MIPATIRGKLLLVFAMILAAAGVGAIAAHRVNILVQSRLALINDSTFPALVIAQRVSELTTSIRTAASAMVNAESQNALGGFRATLDRDIAAVENMITSLDAKIDPETTTALNSQMVAVEHMSTQLADAVAQRIRLTHQLNERVLSLAAQHMSFNEAIRPLVQRELAFLDDTSARIVGNTRETVGRLNEISFKGLIPVLTIGAQVARLEEALRKADTAKSTGALDDAWEEYVSASAIVRRNLDDLRLSAALSDVVDVPALVERFDAVAALGNGPTGVFERYRKTLASGASLKPDARAREGMFAEFSRMLRLSITLIRGETVMAGVDLNQEVRASVTAMNEASVGRYGALLGLEALGNRVAGILTVSAYASSSAAIVRLRDELQGIDIEFSEVLKRLERSGQALEVVRQARSLMEFASGESSVLDQRVSELTLQDQVRDLLAYTESLTEIMSLLAANVVTIAQAQADTAARDALETLDTGRRTLLIVLGASLVTITGAAVYVHRNLGSRLGAFSNAALSLAEGHLGVALPAPKGNDELSRLMRALVVFRDTAADMEASNMREIARMRQTLVDAIESMSEGFAYFDGEERLVIANSRYRDVFLAGVAEAKTVGSSFESIVRAALDQGLVPISSSQWADWLAWRLAQFRHPGEPIVLEYADGAFVQIDEQRTSDGGTVVLYADVTERMRHEKQLTDAKDAAEAANQAKSNFLANVSHELRTPLTSILGFTRIVQKRFLGVIKPGLDLSDEAVGKAARQIEGNLDIVLVEGVRLTNLVNDVLDLEKIEAGEMVWKLAPTDLTEVIRRAASATESLYRQKHLECLIDVPEHLPEVMGDPDRLVQVLINLISNAVKFTREGGIRCTAEHEGDHRVWVHVTDSGAGIAEDDLDIIFEKFRQVGDALTEKPAGTGLGLPICREIIRHHGGEISVCSDVGTGSTFSFWLPVTTHADPE